MTLIVLGEAGEEFAESVQYYESKEVGLGARFRDEVVEAVLERIEQSGVTDDLTTDFADNALVPALMLPT